MAKTKQGGKTRQHRNRVGKRLGVKKFGGESISIGQIIVRQRGTKIRPGKNVEVGRDHTIFAKSNGKIEFFNRMGKTVVSVIESGVR